MLKQIFSMVAIVILIGSFGCSKPGPPVMGKATNDKLGLGGGTSSYDGTTLPKGLEHAK